MLNKVNEKLTGTRVRFGDAKFPAPFSIGLEYSAPARGTWNIVHTGMLLPETHEIFVCAQGCLRGVVLTAAEMNAESRFSTIAVRENNVTEGDMEKLIIDGVGDILEKLPKKPRAVLLYTSCVHHFIGCDLPAVYKTLRELHPDVEFTDCYMNPIMRKSGLTPDQLMRRQLYSLLDKRPLDPKAVNLIGSDFPIAKSSELYRMIDGAGFKFREICGMRSFDEYKELAEASANVTIFPAARAAGDYLEKRFGQKQLYLPYSYGYEEISRSLGTLAAYLGIEPPDCAPYIERCESELELTLAAVGKTPVTLDYTLTYRPLSLARLLLEHGFAVIRVYADSFTGEEKEDFEFLAKNYPDVEIAAASHAGMRFAADESSNGGTKSLALGQKAAYFENTPYFVNMVEGGGLWGFDGIVRLCGLLREAYETRRDTRELISVKGMGCASCL